MSRSRGEGRAAGEKGATLLSTPEARRQHREMLQRQEAEWREKNGPVSTSSMITTVYVDGACTLEDRDVEGRHSGPGGWAWVRLNPDGTIFSSKAGAESSTTNQRMELTAGLMALRDHRKVVKLEIVSDSAYLVNCFLQDWHVKWVENDWRSSSGKPVQNRDLWEDLLAEVAARGPVDWRHVRGHMGDPGNEAADQYATEAKHALMDTRG